MTKIQFKFLTALGGVLAIVILTNVFLASKNQKLNNQVVQYQQIVNDAKQKEVVLRQLGLRIAQTADQDPEMRKLMVKHNLKATLTVDGKKKEYP